MSDLHKWNADRRSAAAQVYNTEAGKWFLFYLMKDMCFFDPVTQDDEIVMRNFAIYMLREYFGVLEDSQDHQSMVLEAMMAVPRPEERDDE